jgi:hypothetical protein
MDQQRLKIEATRLIDIFFFGFYHSFHHGRSQSQFCQLADQNLNIATAPLWHSLVFAKLGSPSISKQILQTDAHSIMPPMLEVDCLRIARL